MAELNTARLRDTADLDSRAGAPVGNALRAAADEIDSLRAAVREAQDRATRAEVERDQAGAKIGYNADRAQRAEAEVQRLRERLDEAIWAENNEVIAHRNRALDALDRVRALCAEHKAQCNTVACPYCWFARDVLAALGGGES